MWSNFVQTTNVMRSYLLQALSKKQNGSYITVTNLVWFTSEKKRLFVQIYKMWTVIRPTWGMPTTRAYVYSTQIQKWQNVKSQEEFNVTRKNDLNSLQSECEILKLRKNILLENFAKMQKKAGIANQRNIARKDTTLDHQLIITPPFQIPDIVINKRTKTFSYYKRKCVWH